MWKKIKPYVISVLIALGVGGLSALVTSGNTDVYDNVVRPPLAPPSWLFPVAWTILFILMGISSAIIYTMRCQTNPRLRNDALKIYTLNLIVNFMWSVIFFNLRAFLFAFIWILLLWLIIIFMITRFGKISRTAAYLQIPYLLWVTFAAYLNLAIYILN